MYNQIQKQHWLGNRDANVILLYLYWMETKNPLLYWSHEIDNDGVLQNLFRANGKCQFNYELFGGVLSFDASYRRNKYKCLLVVFSKVNYHLQIIVFTSAIIFDEGQDTYMWLLERFVEVMKKKNPKLVIIDGDLSMRNAI